MIVLLGVHVPQRHTRAVECRLHRQRRREIGDRRRRRVGQQSLDVILERDKGRMRRAGRQPGSGRNLPGHPAEGLKQVVQRAPLGHVVHHPRRLEGDDARVHDQHVAIHSHRAENHFRSTDDLRDPDNRGLSERGRWRHLETLERLLALQPRDWIGAGAAEIVGEQNRCSLAQPDEMRIALRVLERHHQDAIGRGGMRAGQAVVKLRRRNALRQAQGVLSVRAAHACFRAR